MENRRTKQILAIITMDREGVAGGGAPAFIAKSKEGQERIAFEMAKALSGDAYGLVNGDIVIIG